MKKIYTLLRSAVAIVSLMMWTHASALELESGKLYGYVLATNNYYMTAANFYSFDLAAPGAGTKIGNAAMLSYKPDVAGTFLDNGEYIGVGKQSSYSTTKMIMRLSLGSDGYWTALKTETASFFNATAIVNDNGTLYTWYQPLNGANWRLGTIDPDLLTVTQIDANGVTNKMMAMAAADGKLYGIDTAGDLYTIAKESGAITKVGSTGKTVPDNAMSACYDSARGAILWARYDGTNYYSKTSQILTVDPSTAASALVGTLTYAPQVLGLYTPVSISADAPGEVDGLTATNAGTDNDIKVTFTMPTKNYGGTDFNPNLQGLSYTIAIDGTVVVDKKASAIGAQVSETVTSTPGTHTVSVFASQTVYGDGPETKTSLFVGMDTPGAPKNVKAVSLDTDVTVSWEAPDGQNGGKYDLAKLAYKVVRLPGEVVVADKQTETTFSETITTDKLQGYSYRIITLYDDAEGLSAESAQVFAGPSFEVTRETPYLQDFQSCETAADAGFFLTGVTANPNYYSDPVLNLLSQDDNKYLQVTPDADYTRVNNPKVFTTALKLKKRHTYRLSFKFRTAAAYGASFSVYLSDKPTADCQNIKTIIAEKSYGYPDDKAQEFTDDRVPPTEFQVDETGVYYVSVQHGFLNDKWDFDDVKVEDITEPGIPGTPKEMKAEAAEGSRDVKISFTLPTEDNNGDDPKLTSVEIKRDDITVETLTEGLAAGAAMSWTDEHAPLGSHIYTVVASNANGSSAPASAAIKVGRDYDLTIASVDAPASVVKGRKFTITATVHNNGINPAPMGEDDYTLALVRNVGTATEVVATRNAEVIRSDQNATFTFDLSVPENAGDRLSYYFYLTYELDENMEDNRSSDFTVEVITPEFPAPTGLSASWNEGKFDLTWTAPAYDADIVTLTGYDIYADGAKLNGDTPVTATEYSVAAEADKQYEYHVVAVYDLGSSAPSDKVAAFFSGIASIDGNTASIVADGNSIRVSGFIGSIDVYSTSGTRVAGCESAGEAVTFELGHGAYILVVGSHATKVIL